ncbi:sulfite exporter TauE/SafE family protein [Herbihabitans rhizosphaerae]|nr:sulfite exporter TauE/SafE family protein [Herbihabitans rhizosphaerae]
MTGLEAVAVMVAGVFAGGINAAVGSGTLISFPVLLAVGLPPVVANVSNSLGLVPGSVAGAIGYRKELAGQRRRLWRLGFSSVLGGVTGALLLLVLPPEAFETIVPILIALAVVLVILQPWIARKLRARQGEAPRRDGPALLISAGLCGVYGGYFGASQGVLLVAIMGILMDENLQRVNAVKNVYVAVVNLVAGIVFIFVAEVAWIAVLALAVGAAIGGLIGAKIGRKLPPHVLRGAIVVVGVVAILQLLL